MNNRFLKLFAAGLVLAVFNGCSATKHADPNRGYQLVWADEFNKNGTPDSLNWRFERGFERNEEWQWYQPNNAWCQDGLLIIEGRRETKPNPLYVEGSKNWRQERPQINYTSASIKTAGLHTWQYGRFIMRGRIDISEGLWPAWWTVGTHGHWPATGEIDMMEFYRRTLLANMVYFGANKKDAWFTTRTGVDSLGGEKWSERFHVWRMDWDEKEIALYVDDILLNKVQLSQMVNHDGTGINPFKQPHYMLLNLAIGGQQGGDADKTSFPRRFEIDYIRVYQKKKP